MVDITKLRSSFKKYNQSKKEYWDDLFDKVKDIYNDFSEYIGVKDATFLDNKDKPQQYLQYGVLQSNCFLHGNVNIYEEEKAVYFTLRFYLDEETNSPERIRFDFTLKLTKKGSNYIIVYPINSTNIMENNFFNRFDDIFISEQPESDDKIFNKPSSESQEFIFPKENEKLFSVFTKEIIDSLDVSIW